MGQFVRHFWQGGVWFEELGFYYVGPIDGHDLQQLLPVLPQRPQSRRGPILVHVVTKKERVTAPPKRRGQISRREQV
jgi:1-deoxy-D-xylulose-5-phosphate synthase